MPHKFNGARGQKFENKQYKIINWPAYNESLQQCEDVTIWLNPQAEDFWHAKPQMGRWKMGIGPKPKACFSPPKLCYYLIAT